MRADSLVLAAMREKFTGRAVMSGSGAGAAVLAGGPVPISGHSYDALAYSQQTLNTKFDVERASAWASFQAWDEGSR